MIKKSNPISILFIGNSFSYYHSLPKLVAYFAKASDSARLTVDGVFWGGATLKALWDDGGALQKLRSKAWDYVVLQERGRLGGVIKRGIVHVGNPRVFTAYATRFDKTIREVGAKTILYCPPAFLGVGFSDDAKKLHTAYVRLARKLHAIMIPSEIAFALALKERPHMKLYERDKQHPSLLGTYLIASLFYRKLFHKRAHDLPLESYITRSQRLPQNSKRAKLSRADAQFLWSIANRVI